jgi:hypothetical protein
MSSSKKSPAYAFAKNTPSDMPAARRKGSHAKTMARYGITRVPVDYYHYGTFRYTNLDDAIAEAKRSFRR